MTQKNKVLIYRSQLLPISETFIQQQAVNLKSWNFLVVGRDVVENGINVSALDPIILPKRLGLLGRVERSIRRIFDIPDRLEVALLKKQRPALVHAHFGPDALEIAGIARALKIPLLVTLHGYDINICKKWWEDGGAGYVLRNYPKRIVQLAKERQTRIIAVSQAIKDSAIEYGIPSDKIEVCYIGVDTKRFVPGPIPVRDRRAILFVGRLVEKKGCRFLLEAFHRIQDYFPEFELIIAGAGPLRNDLEEYAQLNKVRAKFIGAQTSEQIRQHMNSARVLCLPSVTADNGDAEGLGIVILEAQSCGVPVITSARGGAAEGIIDGVTGFSHQERDVEALSKALKKLISDDVLIDAFSIAARRFIEEKMDLEIWTRSLESIYDKALKNN